MLGLADGAGVLELSLLGGDAMLEVVVTAVLDIAVLDAGHVVRVLLGGKPHGVGMGWTVVWWWSWCNSRSRGVWTFS